MKNNNFVAIIQARMGSTRLPRKSAKILGQSQIIDWVVKRVKKAKLLDDAGIVTVSDLLNADEKEILAIDGFGEKTLEDVFNLVANYVEANNEEEVKEEVNVEQLLDDLKEQESVSGESATEEKPADDQKTEKEEDNQSETTAEETPITEGELTLEEKSK